MCICLEKQGMHSKNLLRLKLNSIISIFKELVLYESINDEYLNPRNTHHHTLQNDISLLTNISKQFELVQAKWKLDREPHYKFPRR